jgi:hypothetical protein
LSASFNSFHRDRRLKLAMPDRLRDLHAYRASVLACLINAAGAPVDIWLGRNLPEFPAWPALLSSAAGLLLAAILVLRRQRATLAFSSGIFLLNNAVLLWFLWTTAPYFSGSAAPWTPFQANKLGMLIVAALGPELLPGAVVILGFLLSALVRMDRLTEAQGRSNEPTILVVFAIVALALLVFRVRGMQLERALARSKAEADAAHELNRRLLSLRDLANTPLQSIEVGVALLEKQCPEAIGVTEKLARAVERMRNLQPLLSEPAEPEERPTSH